MAPPDPRSSETPCYTCRRRRVICDKALPTCQKCRVSGRQCLGYKKPLTWVRGVASRGKMMGLTFDDVAGRQRGEQARYSDGGMRDSSGYHSFGAAQQKEIWSSYDVKQQEKPQHFSALSDNGLSQCVDHGYQREEEEEEGLPPSYREGSEFQATSAHGQSGILPALLDPIKQDLDEAGRYYLSYYDTRFCRLLVLYDSPHENPYRRLIPLIQSSPLLFNAISAVAACHYMHSRSQNAVQPLSEVSSSSGNSSNVSAGAQEIAGGAIYRHVLMFKQRALRQLHQGMSELYKWSDETTLASILLLGHLELLDSGQGDWQIHVQGARQFIKDQLGKANRRGTLDNQPVPVSPRFNDSLNTFLTGTCMTMDIMGSTLAPSGSWSEPIYSRLMRSPALLSQIEQVMFIGCPSYLLRLILFITSLRHGKVSAEAAALQTDTPSYSLRAEISSVLKYIEDFDPAVWALEMHSRMSPNFQGSTALTSHPLSSENSSAGDNDPRIEPLGSLFHLATAYKLAIRLYATRVLLRPSPRDTSLATEVTGLLSYLSRIPVTSELFKCTIWPVFIAGTECRDPEERRWIQNSLQNLWNQNLSMNIKLAAEALDHIWGRDEKPGGCDSGNHSYDTTEVGDWIQLLDQLAGGWLFI